MDSGMDRNPAAWPTDFVNYLLKTDSREWMISASLALLCMVKVFYRLLLRHPHYPTYYRIDYLAAICDFAVLTIVWLVFRIVTRNSNHPRLTKALRFLLLIPFILLADFLRPFFIYKITGLDLASIFQVFGKKGLLLAALLLGYLGIQIIWRYEARFQKLLEGFLLGIVRSPQEKPVKYLDHAEKCQGCGNHPFS